MDSLNPDMGPSSLASAPGGGNVLQTVRTPGFRILHADVFFHEHFFETSPDNGRASEDVTRARRCLKIDGVLLSCPNIRFLQGPTGISGSFTFRYRSLDG